jgi:hypothetical protein
MTRPGLKTTEFWVTVGIVALGAKLIEVSVQLVAPTRASSRAA